MSADPFDRLVALRPEVPDEHDWASSPAADAALRRVHAAGAGAPKPSWWRRRRFVVPTVVIGLGAAVAGGVAFAPAGREPAVGYLICLDRGITGDPVLGGTQLTVKASHAQIVAECNSQYEDAGHALPADFALCVAGATRGQEAGGAYAVPSKVRVTAANAASVCQAAGYEPIR